MKKRRSFVYTLLFSALSTLWLYPLFVVLINSFKKKAYVSRAPFALPDERTWAALTNYEKGAELTRFGESFLCSLIITALSVALILLCTSMCAWFITRVRTRMTHTLYLLFLFSMVVPFQMVMFTLSKIANLLRLNTPLTIPVIYLGFGAGLAVFMFTGFVKSSPIAVEESAMIDGANPFRIFFSIVLPVLRPTGISVGILQVMWIWNDYLLPYLVLDLKKYKTIPIAVQYLRGGYGSVDMGAMMAMLVLAILPVTVFYLLCQRYIVSGILSGAVKG